MATTRQKKLAQAIVANAAKDKPEPIGALLEKVGYAVSTSEAKPGQIVAQEGVQQELSALGFTVENAKAVTAKILLNEKSADRDRLKASEMVFKVHGAFQPEDTNDKPRIVNIFNNPVFESATRAYEQSLKELIIHGSTQPIPQSPQDSADEHE